MRDGPEFGDLEGEKFIVKKALYGIKSAGLSYILFIPRNLDEMRFTSCVSDPYVWRMPSVKSDSSEYYKYVMTYVDDIIDVSMYTVSIIDKIERFERLKNDKINILS